MANTIISKNSSTQSSTPTTGAIQLGELAVNTYDGKLFLKKNDGSEAIVDLTDVFNDKSPELGGTLDALNNKLDNVKVVVFNGTTPYDIGTKTVDFVLDPMNGQHQKVTVDDDIQMTFTNPDGPCVITLHIHQGSTGGYLIIPNGSWIGGEIVVNTLTPTTGHDILTIHYYGGGNYAFEMLADIKVDKKIICSAQYACDTEWLCD